jgi:hypothetical protein
MYECENFHTKGILNITKQQKYLTVHTLSMHILNVAMVETLNLVLFFHILPLITMRYI